MSVHAREKLTLRDRIERTTKEDLFQAVQLLDQAVARDPTSSMLTAN